jgi:hypothetical protein
MVHLWASTFESESISFLECSRDSWKSEFFFFLEALSLTWMNGIYIPFFDKTCECELVGLHHARELAQAGKKEPIQPSPLHMCDWHKIGPSGWNQYMHGCYRPRQVFRVKWKRNFGGKKSFFVISENTRIAKKNSSCLIIIVAIVNYCCHKEINFFFWKVSPDCVNQHGGLIQIESVLRKEPKLT